MLSTILLSISFFTLSVVVIILNVRLNSLMERLSDISKDKVGNFEFGLLRSDVESIERWKRDFNSMYDYLSLKDKAICARAERLRERERQGIPCFEIKVDFNSKYNPKKTKNNGK